MLIKFAIVFLWLFIKKVHFALNGRIRAKPNADALCLSTNLLSSLLRSNLNNGKLFSSLMRVREVSLKLHKIVGSVDNKFARFENKSRRGQTIVRNAHTHTRVARSTVSVRQQCGMGAKKNSNWKFNSIQINVNLSSPFL